MRHKITRAFTVVIIAFITVTGYASNKYWVNGTGSWNDPNHWAEISGGVSGTSIPTQFDNVFFDDNSFSQDGQQVIIKEQAICNDFIWEVENYKVVLKSKSFIFSGITNSNIQVFGSVYINENIKNKFFGEIVLKGESENSLKVLSVLNSDIIISTENGKYKLEEDIVTNGDIYLKQGSFITQNNRIECESFIGTGDGNRVLNIGESELTVSLWDFSETKNLEFSHGKSVIIFKDDLKTRSVKLGDLDYYQLQTLQAQALGASKAAQVFELL